MVHGVALRGDGYPNAEGTLDLLRRSGEWDVQDRASWLPEHLRLWHLIRGPLSVRCMLIARLTLGGFFQSILAIVSSRRGDVVYLPYPAPFTGWWLSLVPECWRPGCVADAYISLWDSMFRDRKGGRISGWASRLAHRYERRALRAMKVVLVDTIANERQMAADFSLPREKVRSIPLALNLPESGMAANAVPTPESNSRMRVLFVGTLVPLHGIEVVLSAIGRLSGDSRIEFRLVGDGQQGALVELFVREHAPANLEWVREWLPQEGIAREIASADVCLGVFGGEGKASRVLPFKVYHALAAGKAIVTQAPYSLPEGAPPLPAITVEGSEVGARAANLAAVLSELARDRARISSLGAEAGEYFKAHLSDDAVVAGWRLMIDAQ